MSTSYSFRAIRADGSVESGTIEAASREAARALIGRRGIYPIEVSPGANSAAAGLRARSAELGVGLRALGTLLESGLPISRALAVLAELVPRCWITVLPSIRSRIDQGDSLAQALRASRLPFPPHALGIIEAGEAGGGLAPAVVSAAQMVEARAATTAAVWNALSYPIVLALTGMASIALLVGMVLPRFTELITDAGQTVPLLTRLMLRVDVVVQAGMLPALACTAASTIAWQAWTGRPEGRRQWHRLLLGIPAVGPIRRSSASAGACASLAGLLRSGVQLAAALPLAARAAGDAAIEGALLAARTRMLGGESLSAALQVESALTVTSIRFVRIGEETGTLSELLDRAAQIESAHALQQLKRLIRFIEPALIVGFGGVVMLVAAALLQAVYAVRPAY